MSLFCWAVLGWLASMRTVCVWVAYMRIFGWVACVIISVVYMRALPVCIGFRKVVKKVNKFVELILSDNLLKAVWEL